MVYLSTEPSVDTDLLQADGGRVFELCLDFLGLEMQPSVRHYQEWMCMRLMSRFPGLVAKLWPAFEKVSFLILSVIRNEYLFWLLESVLFNSIQFIDITMLTNSQFLLLMIMKIYIQCFESIFHSFTF